MNPKKTIDTQNQIFHIVSLGCKVNQYETQALREAWSKAGYTESDDPAGAGVIVIHTCAVTANAVADVRAMIRRMHRAAPQAAIQLMGCAAEACAKQLAALPGVDKVVQRQGKTAFILNETNPDQTRTEVAGVPAPPAALSFPPLSISAYKRARPVVKIQDGCSHGCTYCIVPLTRGRSVSRPPADIVAEMERLHRAGFQELIISGINLRQYGRDFPKTTKVRDFWTLLAWLEERLAPAWAGRVRWRLSSLEPGQLNEDALAALSESRLIAPHLHISLQSGSPAVLRRMGRGHYQPESLPEFLKALQPAWPVMGLGADLLMGFPGESEAEFAETRALAEKLPLTYAHVFPFSPRPGTMAAGLPDQLPREVTEERAAAIRAIAAAKKENFLYFLAAHPEKKLHMVLESRDTALGVNEYYASCRLPAAEIPTRLKAGMLLSVRPVRVEAGLLLVAPHAF